MGAHSGTPRDAVGGPLRSDPLSLVTGPPAEVAPSAPTPPSVPAGGGDCPWPGRDGLRHPGPVYPFRLTANIEASLWGGPTGRSGSSRHRDAPSTLDPLRRRGVAESDASIPSDARARSRDGADRVRGEADLDPVAGVRA